ncbi:hypothetical protein [Burkholderia guangdongensis]|uniref:hypothetical protein n=1 Tax=Burkholderia guangdongensis TaxID=1792500 RepID=UPI0015CC509A|nr:hypothetical protein [Burkholderia guangdongensis]
MTKLKRILASAFMLLAAMGVAHAQTQTYQFGEGQSQPEDTTHLPPLPPGMPTESAPTSSSGQVAPHVHRRTHAARRHVRHAARGRHVRHVRHVGHRHRQHHRHHDRHHAAPLRRSRYSYV